MQTTTANPIKVYLGVEVDFGSDGVMLPRTIIWEDGTRFEVDRVLDTHGMTKPGVPGKN